MSNQYALIGGYENSVYIYMNKNGKWIQDDKLVPNVYSFGRSVFMSKEYAVVGAPFDDSGSAFILQLINGKWIQTAKIFGSDTVGENFGYSVCISNGYAIVGAPYDYLEAYPQRLEGGWDNGYFSDYSDGYAVYYTYYYRLVLPAGAAYIFKLSDGIWQLDIELRSNNADDIWDLDTYVYYNWGDTILNSDIPDVRFGRSVSIWNEYALIGAAGSAFIFKLSNGEWIQDAKLVGDDISFGSRVSLSNGYALISAVGSAYIFKLSNGDWTQDVKLETGAKLFGYTVSLFNEHAVVGTPYVNLTQARSATHTNTSVTYSANNFSGSAFIFQRINGQWKQLAELEYPYMYDEFHIDVAFGIDFSITNKYVMFGGYKYHDGLAMMNVYTTTNYDTCCQVWQDALDKNSLINTTDVYLIKSSWTKCAYTAHPTRYPTEYPTINPTTNFPTTSKPTANPTFSPTRFPTSNEFDSYFDIVYWIHNLKEDHLVQLFNNALETITEIQAYIEEANVVDEKTKIEFKDIWVQIKHINNIA
eukprot:72453_1